MSNNTLPDLEIDAGLKLVSSQLKLSDDVVSCIEDTLNKYNNIGLPIDLDVKYSSVANQINIRDISKQEFKKNIQVLLSSLISNPILNSREVMNIILALTNRVIEDDKDRLNYKNINTKKKKKK